MKKGWFGRPLVPVALSLLVSLTIGLVAGCKTVDTTTTAAAAAAAPPQRTVAVTPITGRSFQQMVRSCRSVPAPVSAGLVDTRYLLFKYWWDDDEHLVALPQFEAQGRLEPEEWIAKFQMYEGEAPCSSDSYAVDLQPTEPSAIAISADNILYDSWNPAYADGGPGVAMAKMPVITTEELPSGQGAYQSVRNNSVPQEGELLALVSADLNQGVALPGCDQWRFESISYWSAWPGDGDADGVVVNGCGGRWPFMASYERYRWSRVLIDELVLPGLQ